ncbi:MAG: hypothetical protein J6Y16_01150 [Treponema sp.]|nr:hypothetical protein [Treponema sp.]
MVVSQVILRNGVVAEPFDGGKIFPLPVQRVWPETGEVGGRFVILGAAGILLCKSRKNRAQKHKKQEMSFSHNGFGCWFYYLNGKGGEYLGWRGKIKNVFLPHHVWQ